MWARSKLVAELPDLFGGARDRIAPQRK
jgi:hypothetical protein